MNAFKLSDRQRKLLDDAVLSCVTQYKEIAASRVSIYIERNLAVRLPPRPDDFYRYVDASLQRHRKAGRIRTKRVNGLSIWALV